MFPAADCLVSKSKVRVIVTQDGEAMFANHKAISETSVT